VSAAAGGDAGSPPVLSRRAFESRSEADTAQLGAAFAAAFRPDARRALRVGLRGDLGAGKTTFVRGLLRRLGVDGPIRSPTYSLIEHHLAGAYEVIHGDLYRLESPAALAALALDEFDRGASLWLIEWPEQGGAALPAADLALVLSVDGPVHHVVALAGTPEGAAWLDRLGDAKALEVGQPAP
jgi:tRNA threonylcarbamoyladenosine biosynthesis protein TsaE